MPYFHGNILLIGEEIDEWIVTTLRSSRLAPLSKTYSGLMLRELCTYSAITPTPSLVKTRTVRKLTASSTVDSSVLANSRYLPARKTYDSVVDALNPMSPR